MRNFVQFLRISSLRKNNNHKLCGFQRRISEASHINKYFVYVIRDARLVAWCCTSKLFESIADFLCKSSIFRTLILLCSRNLALMVNGVSSLASTIFSISKNLRRYLLYDRKLLSELCRCNQGVDKALFQKGHHGKKICRKYYWFS